MYGKHDYMAINADRHIQIYSNGVSEEVIGKAIKKYEIPRHKLVILTKCFCYIGEDQTV